MRKTKKMRRFKKIESYKHREAVKLLCRWLKGKREVMFEIDGYPLFVADVVTYTDDIVQRVYEVTHKHPIDGKKLGRIQYWCYRNMTPLTVFEVSADYILNQVRKPKQIDYINYFIIDEPIINCDRQANEIARGK